jgi:tetratricopeptide (TPR) repeat protein
MLKRSRQQVHARVAKALEEKFPEVANERPDLLAHHHAGAEQKREAIAYAQKAALAALMRSAFEESIAQATEALGWIQAIEDPRARAGAELALNGLITPALMSSKGWMAPELKAVVDRSYELQGMVEDSPYIAATLWVLALYYYLGANSRDKVRALFERLVAIARKTNDAGLESATLSMFGHCEMVEGRLAETKACIERILQVYDPVAHRGQCYLYGQDSKAGGCAALAPAVWYLGYPEQALAYSKLGLEWARELNHANSIGLAMYYHLFLLYERGERAEILKLADTHKAMADRYGLREQVAYVNIFRGWAKGDPEEIERNFTTRLAGGNNLDASTFNCLLAEAESARGRHDAAIERLERGLELTEQLGEPYSASRILRRKGLVLLERDASAYEAAEACFRQAIEVAQKQGAKMHELQATTALSQSLLRRGAIDEARSRLAPVYAWFTEGFETPQLKEARDLLAAIESSSADPGPLNR